MAPDPAVSKGAVTSGLCHWLGFLASGGIAFATDAGLLFLLTRHLGVEPIVARALSIPVAIVASWLAHRTLTFRMPTPPSLVELTRFAGLQSLSALVNFGAYAAVLLWRPGTEPLVALVAASCVAMVVAYVGMRFAVFRGRR